MRVDMRTDGLLLNEFALLSTIALSATAIAIAAVYPFVASLHPLSERLGNVGPDGITE